MIGAAQVIHIQQRFHIQVIRFMVLLQYTDMAGNQAMAYERDNFLY